MPSKIHSLLFLFFLVVFITAAPLALLYSEGYRYDFDDNEVIKTGGLSFSVRPDVRAEIYLNGERKKKIGAWGNSTYLNALTPDNYKVSVQKESFHPWNKTMKVKQGKVTEAKNILMVPKEPELKTTVEGIKSFKTSPDKNKLIYQDSKDNLNIYNLKEDTKKSLELPTTTFRKWGPDSERILVNASGTYYLIQEDEQIKLSLPSDLDQVHFNPESSDELLYTRKDKDELLKLNYTNDKEASSVILNYLDYDITGQGIFWLSPSGQIYQSDFSGSIQTTLNSEPIPTEGGSYELVKEGGKTLILEDKTLYTLAEEEFKQLASNVKKVKLSPHNQKAVLISDHEINVIYLNKQYGQPRKEKFEDDFINRFSQQIDKVSWFGSHHLIFNLEGSNKIKISGIDNRSQINMVNFIESDFDKWSWNGGQKFFYLLKDNTLHQNSFLKD